MRIRDATRINFRKNTTEICSMKGDEPMPKITRAMKYEIVKPVDCTWEEFGKVINSLRYKCARVANRSVQMLWDWNNYKHQYKREHGEYPDKSEAPNFYKILRGEYPDVGTQVISQVLQYVQIKFIHDFKEICSLKKGIPFYRDNMPICIHNQAYIIRNMDGYEISTRLLPEDAAQYWFTFIIKKGSKGQESILEKLNTGEYKKGMLQLIKDSHKKWYAVLSFSFESELKSSNPDKILEVNILDESIKMKNGNREYDIPIAYIKQSLSRIEKRLGQLRAQKNFRGEGRIGHGIKKIFAPMQSFEEKKAHFKTTANHNLSRIIIDKALWMHCGKIQLIGEIPDWTNFDLKEKIKYKAEENGIVFSVI